MKIFCIGKNYAEHAKEMNSAIPTKPLVFMKPSTALLPDNKPFYYPEFSSNIHYEVEVVLKLKKHGRHIDPKFALDYIEEIGLGIDFTARDVQAECKKNGHPWEVAKAFDNSAVIGKFVSKQGLDLDALDFHLTKNGEMVQKGNTKDLIYNFSTIISYISTIFTVKINDLIMTGTPAGVGPIAIGDHLEGFLGGEKMFECEVK